MSTLIEVQNVFFHNLSKDLFKFAFSDMTIESTPVINNNLA